MTYNVLSGTLNPTQSINQDYMPCDWITSSLSKATELKGYF